MDRVCIEDWLIYSEITFSSDILLKALQFHFLVSFVCQADVFISILNKLFVSDSFL